MSETPVPDSTLAHALVRPLQSGLHPALDGRVRKILERMQALASCIKKGGCKVQLTWDDTPIAVLDAAVACAEQTGFSGLTTRRVAELAGVNEVTIFRRVSSKAGLIAAAFEREASAMGSAVGDYTGDLHADLLRMVAAVWDATGRRQLVIPAILSELANNADSARPLGIPSKRWAE